MGNLFGLDVFFSNFRILTRRNTRIDNCGVMRAQVDSSGTAFGVCWRKHAVLPKFEVYAKTQKMRCTVSPRWSVLFRLFLHGIRSSEGSNEV